VAPTWAETDWDQIVTTYDALMRTWPSPVVALNRAAARSQLPGADLTEVLREIDDLALDGYPYLPAARADVLARLGRGEDAAAAYEEALALTTNPVERRYLARARIGCGPWRSATPPPPTGPGSGRS
jgi:RNA polymerase sigma-70 factor (ECF subfamily)